MVVLFLPSDICHHLLLFPNANTEGCVSILPCEIPATGKCSLYPQTRARLNFLHCVRKAKGPSVIEEDVDVIFDISDLNDRALLASKDAGQVGMNLGADRHAEEWMTVFRAEDEVNKDS